MTISTPYVDPRAEALEAGFSPPRRALFLDRDGVVNVNHGYVHTPERTDWVPGIFELVARAREAGFIAVVVTNQAGIARGYYDEAQFEYYTGWVHERFAHHGAPLLATYYCPHHPNAGLGKFRIACGCRKPEPGLLLRAASDWAIDLAASIMVGDQPTDIEAAKRAGVGRTFLMPEGDLSSVLSWFDYNGRRQLLPR